MEYSLFQENTDELILAARQQLLMLDEQFRLDTKAQQSYQDCLNYLREQRTFLYYSPEELQDFAAVPFNEEVMDFLGDFPRLKSVVSATDLMTLADVFNVDRLMFLSWPRCSNAKWEMWVAMRRTILDKKAEILHFHEICFQPKVFPILEEGRSYSLAEKFDLMCEQYLNGLQEYASLHPEVKVVVERLALILAIGANQDEVVKQMGVTRERLRQFKEKYLQQMFEGGIAEVPHLRLDTRLIADLRAFETAAPHYKSVTCLNTFLGCEDYRQTHLPIFLKMRKLFEEGTPGAYTYFDQPYFIPEQESVEQIRTYVSTLIKVLGASSGAEIRPVHLAELMTAMAQLEPNFTFEETVVRELLEQDSWVECLKNEAGEELFQMIYSQLYDYQKIARIVFEEKTVNYDRILQLDREKNKEGKGLCHIGDNAIISRKNYDWVCPSGVEGTLIYEETGKAPLSLMTMIQNLTKDLKIFTFSEMMAALGRQNYSMINENSVKIYILRDCVSSIDDSQLYCHVDYLNDFSAHRWRNRNRNIRNTWVAFAVRTLIKEPTHTLPVEELNRMVFQLLEDNGETCDVDNPVVYMRERVCVRDLLGIENKQVYLMPKALELTEEEIDSLDVNITCKPKSESSEKAEQLIFEQLSAAEGKELPVKFLKEKCLPFFAGKSNTYFYTFIKRKFSFQLERFEREGIPYLRLVE